MRKPTEPSASRVDVYARVTDRILADLEAGVRPWMRPWSSGNNATTAALPLRYNGIPYRGVNVLLLWGDAIEKGFSSSTWLTYKQAQSIGAQVRKGETGSLVVYANRVTKTETNERGEDTERAIAFMKGYTVFNVEQIDGLPAQYHSKPSVVAEPVQRTSRHVAGNNRLKICFALRVGTFQGGD